MPVMDAILVIAASAGGLAPLKHIVAALPIRCTASVFVVMHIGRNRSMLPSILAAAGRLPAAFARSGELIEAGRIYVAPPDNHMFLARTYIRLGQGPKAHYTRPAADILFVSAAEAHGKRVMGIVLSGGGKDGAAGLRMIQDHGGTSLVQEPEEAEMASMPLSALAADHPASLPVQDIAALASAFCSRHW